MVNEKEQGFTLFEVLISMFIAGIAILGLVILELRILSSSQSSFNYTLATIEANSFVDKTWRNLCEIETLGSVAAYKPLYDSWKADLEDPNINYRKFRGASIKTGGVSVDSFTLQDSVFVEWDEKNFDASEDVGNNRVTLITTYPDLTGGCL